MRRRSESRTPHQVPPPLAAVAPPGSTRTFHPRPRSLSHLLGSSWHPLDPLTALWLSPVHLSYISGSSGGFRCGPEAHSFHALPSDSCALLLTTLASRSLQGGPGLTPVHLLSCPSLLSLLRRLYGAPARISSLATRWSLLLCHSIKPASGAGPALDGQSALTLARYNSLAIDLAHAYRRGTRGRRTRTS